MRCKIIEIGPRDAFSTDYDINRFRGQKGRLSRSCTVGRYDWLEGCFVFDDPNQRSLIFHQIRVVPIND